MEQMYNFTDVKSMTMCQYARYFLNETDFSIERSLLFLEIIWWYRHRLLMQKLHFQIPLI